MSEPLSELPSPGIEDFFSGRNMSLADEAVVEVFSMMLGLETMVVPSPDPTLIPGERTAIVGFSGSLRGSCEVLMSLPAALSITSAMLGGAPVESADESIDDAIGELCNMVAGGWKNRLPSLTSSCFLSPPTILSRRPCKAHRQTPSTIILRTYQFNLHTFHLILHREDW